MMFNYSPFTYPNSYGYRQNRYNPNMRYSINHPHVDSYNNTRQTIPQDTKNNNSQELTNESSKTNSKTSNEFFEILGIKLYFDDILLICLLFFLYNEGVQDQYLFISLILLLLS